MDTQSGLFWNQVKYCAQLVGAKVGVGKTFNELNFLNRELLMLDRAVHNTNGTDFNERETLSKYDERERLFKSTTFTML